MTPEQVQAILNALSLIALALNEISGHIVNTNVELDRIAEALEAQLK